MILMSLQFVIRELTLAYLKLKLFNTSGLTGLLSESLADSKVFPKIWIEDGGADDWSNKDDNGLEANINLHIGSRYRGTKN